jgi:hypothetical protein
MNDEHELPENWSELDSHNTFFQYIQLCREAWQNGELAELPPLFRPLPRPAE